MIGVAFHPNIQDLLYPHKIHELCGHMQQTIKQLLCRTFQGIKWEFVRKGGSG
jgi:hypothetical protein